MINEEHISVTAKEDNVLLCATDWKTDLVPCPSRIEGMALLSQRGQAERTSVGQRKVGGSPEEGDSARGEEADVSAASVSSWKLAP